jgi:hypothetical protein
MRRARHSLPSAVKGSPMDRRVILAGGLALLGAGAAEARPRRAGPAPAIVVDVTSLRAKGLTIEADIIQATIASEIARTGPYRGRVLIRIQGLSLNAFAGGSSINARGTGGSGGMSSDYMDGDFQVIGPGGEVLAGQPLVVNAPASSGGAWYLPGNEQRRIEAIARTFAGWVRQYAG